MKVLVAAALVGAQLAAVAEPARAAEIQREATAATGTFAGLRLRMPMGGSRAQQAPRIGLAFAPTVHSINDSGEARMRIGEGLELGFSGRQPLRLTLAGQQLRRLGAAQQDAEDDNDRRGGPSTLGWIAIGVGVAVVIVVGAAAICFSDSDCVGSE
ncbi:MAG TPA: hypothetical protein VLK25_12970 [Allosphingosinicella sp.]|nr:hypothetical protein [Allosphingosinicella sp.]